MFEIIIVSHGEYAKAMRQSAEMIMGEQKHIQTFGLCPGEDIDVLREQVHGAIRQANASGEVLVLTDMISGSPFNVTASAMAEYDFCHIAGVNLPMLLEICSLRGSMSLKEIEENIVDMGKTTIVCVNGLVKEGE